MIVVENNVGEIERLLNMRIRSGETCETEERLRIVEHVRLEESSELKLDNPKEGKTH